MKTNILIFSGGTGSNLLIEYLKKIPDLDITIVVNAYDNGMSTGILRRKINNFLGPSDIRKNVEILCDSENLKKLLKIRTTSRKIENLMYSIMDDKKEIIPKELKNIILSLSINKYLNFKKLFCHKLIIQTLVKELPKKDPISLGNFLFTTLFLIKKDFNESVEIFNNFFLNKNQRVININNGENLYLKAKTKSNKLLNEEEIVDARFKNEEIIDIYLNDRNEIEKIPKINKSLKKFLTNTNLIIYSPGTQFSSLYPSYLTSELYSTIKKNKKALKILITNILKDNDFYNYNSNDLINFFFHYFQKYQKKKIDKNSLVTHFLINTNSMEDDDYLYFNKNSRKIKNIKYILYNLKDKYNKHSANLIFYNLSRSINNKITKSLIVKNKISIIIFNYINDSKKLENILNKFASDFDQYEIEYLIIQKENYSQTLIFERAEYISIKNFNESDFYDLSLNKCFGDYIICYTNNDNYFQSDCLRLFNYFRLNKLSILFGNRSNFYQFGNKNYNSFLRHFISKYGGFAISVLIFIFLNRNVSDYFTGLKIYDRNFLESIRLNNKKRLKLNNIKLLIEAIRLEVNVDQVDIKYKRVNNASEFFTNFSRGIYTIYYILVGRFL